MAGRRSHTDRPLTAEDLITLTGHLSGIGVAAFMLAFIYKAVASRQVGVGLAVATSVGGLLWGTVSLLGAYRLVWSPVPPKLNNGGK